jgi:hypothetical protein
MPNKCCLVARPECSPGRITITPDSSNAGDENPNYTGTATATNKAATICNVSGQETWQGNQLLAAIDYVVTTSKSVAVLPSAQITVTAGLFDGVVMNIKQARRKHEPGKMPEWELYCTERDL